jgi:hypothetical protein
MPCAVFISPIRSLLNAREATGACAGTAYAGVSDNKAIINDAANLNRPPKLETQQEGTSLAIEYCYKQSAPESRLNLEWALCSARSRNTSSGFELIYSNTKTKVA